MKRRRAAHSSAVNDAIETALVDGSPALDQYVRSSAPDWNPIGEKGLIRDGYGLWKLSDGSWFLTVLEYEFEADDAGAAQLRAR